MWPTDHHFMIAGIYLFIYTKAESVRGNNTKNDNNFLPAESSPQGMSSGENLLQNTSPFILNKL